MKFKTLNGKSKDVKVTKYFIKWNDDSLSKFQFNVKQFLKPFWENNLCFEEFPVAGTKMRVDIINFSKRIAIECNGTQHEDPKSFYHKDYKSFLAQVERDLKKEEFCVLNGIKFIEIYETDMPLSIRFFRKKFNIKL